MHVCSQSTSKPYIFLETRRISDNSQVPLFWTEAIYLEIKKDFEGLKNPSNNKHYYVSERLPPMCRELFNAAKDIGMKVVTNNSEVQVICEGQSGKALFRPIHTLDDLDILQL